MNLRDKDWYVYDENYGTSEEKSFVKTFDGLYAELSEKWNNIYLIRNEKAVVIYNFSDGQPFEPDYLLFAKDKSGDHVSYQIFIEPKGTQLLQADKWKEDFLKEITSRNLAKVLADGLEMRIVGLPFYNEDLTKTEFVESLRGILGAKE